MSYYAIERKAAQEAATRAKQKSRGPSTETVESTIRQLSWTCKGVELVREAYHNLLVRDYKITRRRVERIALTLHEEGRLHSPKKVNP